MTSDRLLISGSILLAAWMTSGVAFSQSPGSSKSETIHPDASGSRGGSQSERTGESGVPLPKGSPSSGTVEKGKSGSASSGTSQSPGTKDQSTINPPATWSQGGSRSERTGETGVPLPKGSRSAGTVETGKSMGNDSSATGGSSSMTSVKEAQQALKAKGYDPGAIDGVMGARTKDAIKSFQSASSIQTTGTLDAETAQKLGVRSGSSTATPGSRKSDSNTTVGKDTDQPNQPPAKSK